MNGGGRELRGRVSLRPLRAEDRDSYVDVRRRNAEWLRPWEPARAPPEPSLDEVFRERVRAADDDREAGTRYAFGVFVDDRFAGEITLSGVERGPFQNARLGYWIDEDLAGRGIVPEAVVRLLPFAFEELGLHRVEVNMVVDNQASRRVAEKLGLREEGISERYLQIAGEWRDHIRYAITAEEWEERRRILVEEWLRCSAGG